MGPEEKAAAEAAAAAAAAAGGEQNEGGEGGEAGGGEAQTSLTAEQQIQEIMKLRGGAPEPAVGEDRDATDFEKQLVEQNFRHETQFAMMNASQAVKSAIPDATDDQAFEITKAMFALDPTQIISAVKTALRTEAEKDEKGEDQKDLDVEGRRIW